MSTPSSLAAGSLLADALPAALFAWAANAPVALAALAPDGEIAWANAAFEALAGVAAGTAAGQAVDALWTPGPAFAWLPPPGRLARHPLRRRDGTTIPCDVQCDPAGPGLRLLTLIDRSPDPAQDAEVRRLAGLLEFVQTTARIGMWERDARTGVGQWDPHMFRFFGVDPALGTPSIEQLSQASVPHDRLYEALTLSMAQVGRHSHRYRLLTPEGTLRRVQSQWEVIAGADGLPARVVGLVIDDTETFALASAIDAHGGQLQLATELADVAMWRHDLRTQRIHVNERGFDLLGLAPRPQGFGIDELRTVIHPDDLSEVLAAYRRAMVSHHPEDMQARYRHRDGSWRHLLTRRVTQRDSLGRPIALNGVALDITAQVERVQRNDELARHLDEVTAASGIGIWRIRRDGGDTEWNRQMYALSGVAPGYAPPRFDDWIDCCVHPGDRERVRDLGKQWLRHPDVPAEIAHRIVTPDGEVRYMVARGRAEPEPSPYRLTGVTIDVTERERALAALREATERSALATRAAGIGIWEWDADTGVARWDDEMFLLRGLAPRSRAPSLDEMAAWVHPDDRSFVNDQIHAARVEDRPAYYEFRIEQPDGTVRWIASRSMPVRNEHGRTHMRLGVNWDITEARDAAAARHERALVLRESQAKSELLARMSHELRTPMNAVLGFTQLLLEDESLQMALDGSAGRPGTSNGNGNGNGNRNGADGVARAARLAHAGDAASANATRHSRLQYIREAGEHLLTLINDVLELSRLDGPHRDVVLQPVQLAAVIAQTLPLVEQLARQHGVALVAPSSALYVRADATRLKQVLVNLLSNAIKYNRPGGVVHLDAAPDAGRVRLRVADDGIGMTPAQQDLAFEPFNRAGAEREGIEGTGIGLTIVKALVERMGGTISVSSTPGVGSVFEFSLEAAAESGPHALPTRRLLYVEDNEVNVMIVSELVRRRGDIEFDSVPDGASGVARAAQLLPGLTLVDMQLPDIDGLEVLARLRANPLTQGLRLVALSANAIPGDIQRALDAGFDDYWTKPLNFGVFNAALDRVFGPAARPAAPNAADAAPAPKKASP